jgi:hypothetical protein
MDSKKDLSLKMTCKGTVNFDMVVIRQPGDSVFKFLVTQADPHGSQGPSGHHAFQKILITMQPIRLM